MHYCGDAGYGACHVSRGHSFAYEGISHDLELGIGNDSIMNDPNE